MGRATAEVISNYNLRLMILYPKLSRNRAQSGATLAEIMVALLITVVFFASIFQLNAVCLRYIDATKETVAAMQAASDRLEVLTFMNFSDLATPGKVQTVMDTAANTSELATRANEKVTINRYPTPDVTPTVFTRINGTTALVSTNSNITSTTRLVRVDVEFTWNMTLGRRSRTENISLVVSNGIRKG